MDGGREGGRIFLCLAFSNALFFYNSAEFLLPHPLSISKLKVETTTMTLIFRISISALNTSLSYYKREGGVASRGAFVIISRAAAALLL